MQGLVNMVDGEEQTNLNPIFFSCVILAEFGFAFSQESTKFLLLTSTERFEDFMHTLQLLRE